MSVLVLVSRDFEPGRTWLTGGVRSSVPHGTDFCLTSSDGRLFHAADCQLVSDEGRRLLRSATSRTCVVRRTYSNYGDRCFAAAGPRLWNSLPADLRRADISFEQFKRLLKTFLFGCWDRGALWLTVNLRLISSLTYLLTYLHSQLPSMPIPKRQFA